MRHRCKAEIAEGRLLKRAIGGMKLDPLPVAAMAVAMMQNRRVAIGKPCVRIEIGGGAGTESVEMWREMREEIGCEPQPQHILQRAVDPVEIETGGVAR